ncbi:MAG: DUF3109 family protein [Bacteroidales bacterium]|nr:DUF3109 family protein [Bacteroidales bacterium]
MGKFGTIIQIGDILVSEDVIMEYYACDYEKCKGCCCVIGDSGAPVDESELDELEKYYEVYSPLMQEEGRKAVSEKGFFEIDIDGDIVTPVIPGEPGREPCAYLHVEENGNCLCAIEKCYFAGTCSFRKPISCQLYPIRVTKMPGGGEALNLHRWDICKDAFEKGKKEKIRAYQFLREPLVRAYGQEFYDALCAAAEQLFNVGSGCVK